MAKSTTSRKDQGDVEMKNFDFGVDYYNIDNELITNYNLKNIAQNISSDASEAVASNELLVSQEVAKPKSISEAQAPTPEPPSMTNTRRMVTQYFYNNNSTQKHKLKVRLNHTDATNTEWIATMNKDARVFRKHTDLELARSWITFTKHKFKPELGYKKPYYGKFHLHKDQNGVVSGIQKEPGCYASLSYNTEDESWYAIIAIYDFIGVYEYDFNFTAKQKQQGVKAQLVWTNPEIYAQSAPQTWAQRNGLS